MRHTIAALSTAVADTASDIEFPELPDPSPSFPMWVNILAVTLLLFVAALEWRIMRRARGRNIDLNAIARNDPGIWRTHVIISAVMVATTAVWIVCILYLDYPHILRAVVGTAIIEAAYIIADRMIVTIPILKRSSAREPSL